MDEYRSDEHGSLIEVPENKHVFHKSRVFKFSPADEQRLAGCTLRVAASPGINPHVEVQLREAASSYEDLRCGALRRLVSLKNGSGGTAFPLTPHSSGSALWASCQHVQIGLGSSGSLTTSLDIRLQEHCYWNSSLGFYELPCGQADMPKPSEPASMLKGTFSSAADVAFFEVTEYGHLAEYDKFFVPDSDVLEPGTPITCLGYPGRPDVEYAAKHFWNSNDYAMHVRGCKSAGREPDSKDNFQLDLPTAYRRLLDLCDSDGAFTADCFSAAPGTVHCATDKVVEHTCSTLPQMSGAPCVLLDKPYKVIGVHVQGGGSATHNYNYAVSVRHPFFVKHYVDLVLPELTAMPSSVFSFADDALATVHAYLDQQEHTMSKAQLSGVVAKFKIAHPLR